MIVTLHTPQAIIQHELTPLELEKWAARGDSLARAEVVAQDMAQHTDPHLKIELLLWVLDITNTKPQTPGPP